MCSVAVLCSESKGTGFLAWLTLFPLVAMVVFVNLAVLRLLGILIGWANGAPFQGGDWVEVLAGKHRREIGRVYEVSAERNEVRVDLGEQARRDYSDIFGEVQLYRISAADRLLWQKIVEESRSEPKNDSGHSDGSQECAPG